MSVTIPGLIEDTLADYTAAVRAAVDIELLKAREDGGRIALGYPSDDD